MEQQTQPLNWKGAWEKRKSIDAQESTLRRMMSLTGSKELFGRIRDEDYLAYIEAIRCRMGIPRGASIFEFGCGAGLFLHCMSNGGENTAKMGGVDFSEFLIKEASRFLPGAELLCAEAIDCPREPQYDFVFSNSVFYYFPDLSYAEKVIEVMLAKAGRKVGILRVIDAAFRERMESERRAFIPDYDDRYDGLRYLYYDKEWFFEVGKRLNADVEYFSQPLVGSYKTEFYMNFILTKKSQGSDDAKENVR